MNLGVNPQAQSVESDKAGGVILVVCLGGISFHRGDLRIVKANRRFASGIDDVALI